MNIILMLFNRKKGATVALTLFITCFIILGSVGIIAQISAQQQIETVSNNYTTIAVCGKGGYGALLERDDEGNRVLENDVRIANKVIKEDCRSFFIAHTPGCSSITPYEIGNYKDYLFNGKNNRLAVLAVKCEKITSEVSESMSYISESGEELEDPRTFRLKNYSAEFQLEKMVCCSEGYQSLYNAQKVSMDTGWIYQQNGELPFVAGKKYILLTSFESNNGISKSSFDEDHGEWNFPEPLILGVLGNVSDGDDSLFLTNEKVDNQGEHYYVLHEESIPYCEEYEENIEVFLNSNEGKRWREEVIPFCQKNYQSVSVVATDDIKSVYDFNVGVASIINGTTFSDSDYRSGNKKCLISSLYAQKNDLTIGDSINLELFQGNYCGFGMQNNIKGESEEIVYSQGLLREDKKIGMNDKWVVGGIYTAPEFEYGEHNFSANTIFVPKSSIQNAEDYEDWYTPLLYSIVIKNGMEEEFAKAIKPYTTEGAFVYCNQGYDTVADSLYVLKNNVNRITYACIAGASMGILLFLFLCWKRVFGTMMKMRLLGVSKRKAFTQFIVSMLPMIGIATIAGIGLGAALCEVVLRTLIKVKIPIQLSAIVGAVAVECMVALLLLSIIGALMLTHRLINRKMC